MKRLRRLAPACAVIVLALVLAVVFVARQPGRGEATSLAQPTTVATDAPVADIVSGHFTTRVAEPGFLRFRKDDNGHVSYEVGALKVHPPTLLPVYVVGGSNVREAIQTPAALQQAIKLKTGVSTRVVTFGAYAENFASMLAVIDNLPPGPGVVAISIDPPDFANGLGMIDKQAKGEPLLMASSAVDDVLTAEGHTPPASIAEGYSNYMTWWRRDNSATLKAGKRPWNVYILHDCNRVAEPDAVKRLLLRRWVTGPGKSGGAFFRYQKSWAGVLRAAAELAHAKGYSVVISEGSYDRAVVGRAFVPCRRIYVPASRGIARSVAGWFIDANTTAHLTNRDFRDLYHVLASGRPKWTPALAALLAPAVRQAARAKASPSPSTSPSDSGSPSDSSSPSTSISP